MKKSAWKFPRLSSVIKYKRNASIIAHLIASFKLLARRIGKPIVRHCLHKTLTRMCTAKRSVHLWHAGKDSDPNSMLQCHFCRWTIVRKNTPLLLEKTIFWYIIFVNARLKIPKTVIFFRRYISFDTLFLSICHFRVNTLLGQYTNLWIHEVCQYAVLFFH